MSLGNLPAQASDCATCEGHGEVSVQASDEPMPCPECSNEYLAIRNDIHKDGRAFVYCDVCGCMAPKSVWNRITPRATTDVERERVREAIVKGLRGTYYCHRVWSAWAVGTMGEDDFYPTEDMPDIVNELVDAAIAATKGAKPHV